MWGSPAIVSYDPAASARKPSLSTAPDQQVRPVSELPYDHASNQRAELAPDPVRDPINPIQPPKKIPLLRFSESPRNTLTTSHSSSHDRTVPIKSPLESAQLSESSPPEDSPAFRGRSERLPSWTATDGLSMRGNFDSSQESLGKGGMSLQARHAMSWAEYEAVPTEEPALEQISRNQ